MILDATHAQLLFEDERHPTRAIPKDALLAPLAGPAVADNLDGHWWAIRLTDTTGGSSRLVLSRAAVDGVRVPCSSTTHPAAVVPGKPGLPRL